MDARDVMSGILLVGLYIRKFHRPRKFSVVLRDVLSSDACRSMTLIYAT